MLSRRRSAPLLLALVFAIMLLPGDSTLAQLYPDQQMGKSWLNSNPFSAPAIRFGQIQGRVRTFDGRPVPGANVVVHDVAHSTMFNSIHADSNGLFVFTGLAPGNYDVSASAGMEQAGERVEVNSIEETTVDFRLPHKEAASPGTSNGATVSIAQFRIPAKARSLYEKAAQLMGHGRVDQALEKANAALTVYPRFAEALTLRGIIKEKTGKAEEALLDYQLAIQSDAGFPMAYLAMASALSSLGRFTEAMPVLGQVDRIAPNMWQTSYEFARLSLGKYDFEAALRNIDRASQLHGGPQNDPAEIHLVRGYALLGLSKLSIASDEIHAFLAKQPSGRAADGAREVLSRMQSSTTTASR